MYCRLYTVYYRRYSIHSRYGMYREERNIYFFQDFGRLIKTHSIKTRCMKTRLLKQNTLMYQNTLYLRPRCELSKTSYCIKRHCSLHKVCIKTLCIFDLDMSWSRHIIVSKHSAVCTRSVSKHIASSSSIRVVKNTLVYRDTLLDAARRITLVQLRSCSFRMTLMLLIKSITIINCATLN